MKKSRKNSPDPVFRPIKMERVFEKVASQLRQAIADGLFKVGERLPAERELAEQMGVSRPTVREALQQLEILGLVESMHGGGTIVRSITEQEIQRPMKVVLAEDRNKVVELTEVRAMMESWAARQAAINRTEAELERIGAYLQEMERDLEGGRIRFEIDVKFHTEIAAAAGNTIFLHVIQSIYQLITYSVRIYREEVFLAHEEQETILEHHRRVFEAIRRRDPAAAEAAMNEHLGYVIQEYKNRFMTP